MIILGKDPRITSHRGNRKTPESGPTPANALVIQTPSQELDIPKRRLSRKLQSSNGGDVRAAEAGPPLTKPLHRRSVACDGSGYLCPRTGRPSDHAKSTIVPDVSHQSNVHLYFTLESRCTARFRQSESHAIGERIQVEPFRPSACKSQCSRFVPLLHQCGANRRSCIDQEKSLSTFRARVWMLATRKVNHHKRESPQHRLSQMSEAAIRSRASNRPDRIQRSIGSCEQRKEILRCQRMSRDHIYARTLAISGDGRTTCKQTRNGPPRPPLHHMVIAGFSRSSGSRGRH